MKKYVLLVFAIGLIGIGYFAGNNWSTTADGVPPAKPGSIDDPVVTKSYVDAVLKQSGGSSNGGTAAASLQIVTVPLGKTIIAAEEGTEFIVRSGKAVAYSEDKDGISDLTQGADLTNGKPITNNHLLLSPRVGRGLAPDSQVKNNKLIVLVRGSYELN